MARGGSQGDKSRRARDRMVREQIADRGIRDPLTLAAMAEVPRERFVPQALQRRAYEDGALSIGGGQTISQPYIVARMTELLGLSRVLSNEGANPPIVLDVGTGSGYQAAILAQLGAVVVSIERDPELADAARQRLADLGYDVTVIVGDGSEGYAASAPYAGIVVAAAAPIVPPPLVDQLGDGGRLVIPIGGRELQHLTVVERSGTKVSEHQADACVFVPLLGRHGQRPGSP
jgi:protein-L-isoaspartate(D-aspartate) O-methyltransferase